MKVKHCIPLFCAASISFGCGKPVNNAKVAIKGTSTSIKTDEEGFYEFKDELTRELSISVTKSGYATSNVKLDKNAFIDANFRYIRKDIKLITF